MRTVKVDPMNTFFSIGCLAFGIPVVGWYIDELLSFLNNEEINFIYSKYNFECSGNCAIISKLPFLLFGLLTLYLGKHYHKRAITLSENLSPIKRHIIKTSSFLMFIVAAIILLIVALTI